MKTKVYRRSKKVGSTGRRKRLGRLFGPKSGLRRSLRLFGLAALVFISTLTVFAVITLYGYLRTPLAAAAGSFTDAERWVGEGRRNLLLVVLNDLREPTAVVTALSLMSLNYTGKTLTLAEVPVNVETTISGGYGWGRLSTAYALGGLASPPKNAPLLINTVRNYLGLPIDGYLLIDQPGLEQLALLLGGEPTVDKFKGLLNPFRIGDWPKILNWLRLNIRTNLSLPEIISVGRFTTSVRFDKLSDVSLAEGESLDDRFIDLEVRLENLKVLILNGTNVSGLAVRAQPLVENLGAFVIGLGNAPRQDYQRSLLVSREKSSYTINRLGRIFGITEFKSLESFMDEPNYDYLGRADIVLILGLDKSLDL